MEGGRAGAPHQWNGYFFRGRGPERGVGGYGSAPELRRARSGAHDRSHLVGVLAFALLLVGLVFASTSVLIPALLGVLLLSSTATFLSMRLNPFSVGYYAGTKPSWTAIAMVLLCGLLLLSAAYDLWTTRAAPLLPSHLPLGLP